MHYVPRALLLGVCLIVAGSLVLAQPGGEQPRPGAQGGVDGIVTRLMAFDKNNDGKLSKDEVTDPRLARLVERMDTNKDGVVTKEEIVALATQEAALAGQGPGGPPMGKDGPEKGGFGKDGFGKGGFGKGGFGKDGFGKDGFGKGGFGKGGFGKDGFGKGGFPGGFGRPQPGILMPPPVQDQLKLTGEQKAQLEKLQKDVDARLEKLLTEEQRKMLQEMKQGPRRP